MDDDGERVAYAYVVKAGKVVGDVWLYNRGATPVTPEWESPNPTGLLPFKNPSPLAAAVPFDPVTDSRDVAIFWFRDEAGRVGADISIRGRRHARVLEGVKPGWCVLASREGPIARTLPIT
jgi:hypothetical protein